MKLRDVDGLYAIFVLPILLAWPIVWALERWRTWEACAWLVGVAVGLWCWHRVRERERAGRE